MKYIKAIYTLSLLVLLANGLAYGQTNATLRALNPREGENSVYELSFIPIDTLSENAIFIIILSNQFDNSEARIAGSSEMNGGFEVETRGDSIYISRSGIGQAIIPGDKSYFITEMLGQMLWNLYIWPILV